MKVVIFCGGEGSRIQEFTREIPKPMIEIGSLPILVHIMRYYSHFGVNDFILPLGYKGDVIKNYFINLNQSLGNITLDFERNKIDVIKSSNFHKNWKITMVNTGQKNLKGSRLKQVDSFIEDDVFMVTYGDCLSNVDLDALIKFHRSHGKMVTLTGIKPDARFGNLAIEENRVLSFKEKTRNDAGYVNGGFFVMNRSIFNLLSVDENCDLEYGLLENLAREGELMIYKHDDFWLPMDNIRDYTILNELFRTNQAKWIIYKENKYDEPNF